MGDGRLVRASEASHKDQLVTPVDGMALPPIDPVNDYSYTQPFGLEAMSAQPATNGASCELGQTSKRFDTRPATAADIPAMVEIDLAGFMSVYKGQGMDEAVQRRTLTDMFAARLGLLGGDLMPVVIRKTANGDEEVVGFTHLLRTNKGPETFTSWEDTTAEGWLTDRHDPHGRFMYVITLSMSPAVALEDAPVLLAARARALMVANGCELIYSESRMPKLRHWVKAWCRQNKVPFEQLDAETTARLAEQYFGRTRYNVSSGRELPHDPMLALCTKLGNTLLRLVANAYQDEESLNYGVVCAIYNPIPAHERAGEQAREVARQLFAASHSLDQALALLFETVPAD